MMDDKFFDINLIYDVIDGEADEKTSAEFMKHINECEKCKRAYEEAVKLKNAMKSDAKPSEDFTEKTMKHIKAAKQPTFIKIISSKAFKSVAAVAACLVVGIFVFRSGLLGKLNNSDDVSESVYGKKSEASNYSIMSDTDIDSNEAEIEEIVEESDDTLFEAPAPVPNGISTPNAIAEEIPEEEYEESYDENFSDETRGYSPDDADITAEAYSEPIAPIMYSSSETGNSVDEIIEEPAEEYCLPDEAVDSVGNSSYGEEPEPLSPTVSTAADSGSYDGESKAESNIVTKAAAGPFFEIAEDENAEIIYEKATLFGDISKYSLIVYIPYRDYEELDIVGINEQTNNRFTPVNSVNDGEYIYDGYEYNEDGTCVAELFFGDCGTAVFTENSESTLYLIIYQHK